MGGTIKLHGKGSGDWGQWVNGPHLLLLWRISLFSCIRSASGTTPLYSPRLGKCRQIGGTPLWFRAHPWTWFLLWTRVFINDNIGNQFMIFFFSCSVREIRCDLKMEIYIQEGYLVLEGFSCLCSIAHILGSSLNLWNWARLTLLFASPLTRHSTQESKALVGC